MTSNDSHTTFSVTDIEYTPEEYKQAFVDTHNNYIEANPDYGFSKIDMAYADNNIFISTKIKKQEKNKISCLCYTWFSDKRIFNLFAGFDENDESDEDETMGSDITKKIYQVAIAGIDLQIKGTTVSIMACSLTDVKNGMIENFLVWKNAPNDVDIKFIRERFQRYNRSNFFQVSTYFNNVYVKFDKESDDAKFAIITSSVFELPNGLKTLFRYMNKRDLYDYKNYKAEVIEKSNKKKQFKDMKEKRKNNGTNIAMMGQRPPLGPSSTIVNTNFDSQSNSSVNKYGSDNYVNKKPQYYSNNSEVGNWRSDKISKNTVVNSSSTLKNSNDYETSSWGYDEFITPKKTSKNNNTNFNMQEPQKANVNSSLMDSHKGWW